MRDTHEWGTQRERLTTSQTASCLPEASAVTLGPVAGLSHTLSSCFDLLQEFGNSGYPRSFDKAGHVAHAFAKERHLWRVHNSLCELEVKNALFVH